MKENHFTTDNLPSDEIYDYDSGEKERADREITELGKCPSCQNTGYIHDGVDGAMQCQKENCYYWEKERTRKIIKNIMQEDMNRIKLMNETLKKVYGIMGLPKS